MSELYDTRRYLTQFDVRRIPNLFTDVLVIGSGVAGLRAAIEAAKYGPVLLVTKGRVDESNTAWAQGGIAVVMSPDDTFEAHIEDTLTRRLRAVRPGGGRADRPRRPAADPGTDRVGGDLRPAAEPISLGLEGGHSAPRIVHAMGDATGREVANTLIRVARGTDQLRIFEDCFAIDLIEVDGRCCGVTTYHRHFRPPDLLGQADHPGQRRLRAGLPRDDQPRDRHRRRPRDGLSGGRAVARHGDDAVSPDDAVRGRCDPGADQRGRPRRRSVPGRPRRPPVHAGVSPWPELAPRDVVSRAILSRDGQEGRHLHVPGRAAPERGEVPQAVPDASAGCARNSTSTWARSRIPVRPAAHYMVGGVMVDHDARTPMPGLLACGEAASSGVHGANRLASNSLLEGLVFGRVAGTVAGQAAAGR